MVCTSLGFSFLIQLSAMVNVRLDSQHLCKKKLPCAIANLYSTTDTDASAYLQHLYIYTYRSCLHAYFGSLIATLYFQCKLLACFDCWCEKHDQKAKLTIILTVQAATVFKRKKRARLWLLICKWEKRPSRNQKSQNIKQSNGTNGFCSPNPSQLDQKWLFTAEPSLSLNPNIQDSPSVGRMDSVHWSMLDSARYT